MQTGREIALVSFVLISAVGAFAGCGGVELAWSTQAIVNGGTEAGYASVGRLNSDDGQLCTATLVGYRTALTAAHCLGGSSLPRLWLGSSERRVERATVHPRYTGNCAESRCYNDIAVLQLSSPVFDITPTPLSSQVPSLLTDLILVGYGATGANKKDYGTRRSAETTVAWRNEASIGFVSILGGGGMICYGDSGGPSFAMINGIEAQVGIHSQLDLELGPFDLSPCSTSAWDERADVHLAWIKEVSGGDLFVDSSRPAAPVQAQDEPLPNPHTGTGVIPSAGSGLQVSIVAPTTGTVFAGGVQITVSAAVQGASTPVRGELVVNGELVAASNSAPFEFPLMLPTSGDLVIAVRAEDQSGKTGEATTQIQVLSETNQASGSAAGAAGEQGDALGCGVVRAARGQRVGLIRWGWLLILLVVFHVKHLWAVRIKSARAAFR